MTIRLQEVVRSEVEGGLSGPANPIPSQSIDCGCGQLPCPKLAKFATRRLFVGLMSWIGIVQAAAYAYFYVAGPSIARRFQFDPHIMDWILVLSELTPFALGLLVAYWGDKIHRVAWVGGLVLVQSVSYFVLIIPHLTHRVRVIEETENVTHMSLYAEDNRELCTTASSRIVVEEDEPCYFTLALLIAVQVLSGIANIAYYALGISYLDDNTKKKHVAAFIGIIISVKIIGILLGYILAWGCLRIDAETLSPVESFREQIGAWWLGFPILSILLVVPGLLLSWFPRMLPSEVVEQAAASLLKRTGRYIARPRRLNSQKVGSPNFWPSVGRLFMNIILIFNVLACAFYATAILNFMAYENVILESRFHVPKPTGMLLGFGDPMYSRIISNMSKPVLIGLIVIISGLVIAKAKPSARFIIGYSSIVIFLTAALIFSLTATSCTKRPIVGTDTKGSLFLPKYCNKNCGCSSDAVFRPVCDSKGMFTFYSPCHAGCSSSEIKNGITTYGDCRCVEDMTGKGNKEASDGPCASSSCQIGWLVFEFGALLAYALIASTFVGDLIITLRTVYAQDKSIGIGFWLTWSAIIVNVPGKILYDTIADLTCLYWGTQKSICHLHDSAKLGDYLCYLTGSLLIISFLLKLLVWFFAKDLQIYVPPIVAEGTSGTELQELMQEPRAANPRVELPNANDNKDDTPIRVEFIDSEPRPGTTAVPVNEDPNIVDEKKQTRETPLKYGPLGPGDRRADLKPSTEQTMATTHPRRPRIRNLDSEDELSSSDDDFKNDSSPKIAYRPLDLDSDVESDLSSVKPRSRKRIISKDYDNPYASEQESSTKNYSPKQEFANPANYKDPSLSRSPVFKERNGFLDGSSKTSSFEFSKKRRENHVDKKGDFNEVGLPIVNPPVDSSLNSDSRFLKDVKSLINRYEQNTETDGDEKASVKSAEENRMESKIVAGIPLVAMVPKRTSTRSQSSSGFDSTPEDKIMDARSESRGSISPKGGSNKGSKGTLCTDL